MPFNGRTRKLVMTATRNGYFFVLDRTTGEHLVTSKLGVVNNWAQGLDAKGQPKRNPAQGRHHRRVARERRRPELSAADVLAGHRAVLRPRAELAAHQLPDGARSARLDGTGRDRAAARTCRWGTNLVAIDYKTGKITWRKELNGGSAGLLSTAGGVLFLSNGPNVEAWDAATGKGLWYSQIGGLGAPADDLHARRQAAHAVQRRRRAVSLRAELAGTIQKAPIVRPSGFDSGPMLGPRSALARRGNFR